MSNISQCNDIIGFPNHIGLWWLGERKNYLNDFISRKLLLDELENEDSPYEAIIDIEDEDTTKDIIDKTLKAYREILRDMVENQPIAYDVDKVVEKFESRKRIREKSILLNSQSYYIDKEVKDSNDLYDQFIKTVKDGGRDERN